jgi:hypothetical protein
MPDAPKHQTTDADRLRDFVTVKLTLLVGAARMPRVSKKQIEQALEKAIREVEGWKA